MEGESESRVGGPDAVASIAPESRVRETPRKLCDEGGREESAWAEAENAYGG